MNELPLRDIHLPTDSLWWPPAPGWWVLGLLLIALTLLLPKIRRWMRHQPIKKVCLRELARIRHSIDGEAIDKRKVIQALSVLLRRTVMSYGTRAADANLSGESWIARLNQISGDPCFSSVQCDLLTRGQYQPEFEVDIEALVNSCEIWIKSLPKSLGHAAD